MDKGGLNGQDCQRTGRDTHLKYWREGGRWRKRSSGYALLLERSTLSHLCFLLRHRSPAIDHGPGQQRLSDSTCGNAIRLSQALNFTAAGFLPEGPSSSAGRLTGRDEEAGGGDAERDESRAEESDIGLVDVEGFEERGGGPIGRRHAGSSFSHFSNSLQKIFGLLGWQASYLSTDPSASSKYGKVWHEIECELFESRSTRLILLS